MSARMLYIHALSPIHSGSGQSTDVIDLPVAREAVTNWPVLPGSSIKGVLRDASSANGVATAVIAAFGPETQDAAKSAGGLWFTDGHLLCLPVRSFAGSFAWLSCPLALHRWQRDMEAAGSTNPLPIPPVPAAADELMEALLLGSEQSAITQGQNVYLEDLAFEVRANQPARQIAETIATAVFDDDPWQTIFCARFGIVSDDVFTFLAGTATEVTARVRINDETKTVARGGLWYEEAVPAEAIFAGPIVAAPRPPWTADNLFAVLTDPVKAMQQIGGNASVGRGLARFRLRPLAGGQP